MVRALRSILPLLTLLPAVAAAQDDPRVRVSLDGAPGRGAAEPLVTIVEFSDFQCPFCGRVQETLDTLLRNHAGELRIVFRHNPLPFHQNAMPAAELALEAQAQRGDEGFWQAHDRLFAGQRALERDELLRIAAAIGLDPRRAQQALDDGRHRARIAAEQQRAFEVGARGTPTFFINGRRLVGAQPVEAFERLVVEELAAARALMLRGIPRAGLYDRFMADAIDRMPEPPPPPPPQAPRPEEPAVVVRVPVEGSPRLGPDDALVTVVVFSDFQCPFCGRLRTSLSSLRERFGREVRIVWKNMPLPFHQNAMPAAVAAQEAFAQGGSDLFWRMHDLLFEDQRALDREGLVRAARRLGLDERRFTAGLDSLANRAAVDRDVALAQELHVTGTPTSFVNGRRLGGAQPLDTFVSVVEFELAAARLRVAHGTPRGRIYDTLPIGAVLPEIPALAGTQRPVVAPEPPENVRVRLRVPRDAPALGPRRAPVTIQVFGDFQCPFTARLRATMTALRERFPTEVRIVWRHYPLPFHVEARPAAEAALEARRQGGDAMFWQLFDRLFDRQRDLSPEAIRAAARESGLDVAALDAALARGRHRRRIDADVAALDAASPHSGTPTSFVEGRRISGAVPLETFVSAVEEALAERRGRRH